MDKKDRVETIEKILRQSYAWTFDQLYDFTDRELNALLKIETEAEKHKYETGEGFEEGEIIYCKNKSTPNLPCREVIYHRLDGMPGVFVDEHWFYWKHFFEVNYI